MLMLEQGYSCAAWRNHETFLTKKILLSAAESKCCNNDDIEDARKICAGLGMEHTVLNYGDTFCKEALNRFIDAYVNGRTPNPCVDCNRYLKIWSASFQKAQEIGCDFVVTGHYARIKYDETKGRYLLLKAVDPKRPKLHALQSFSRTVSARTISF